MEASEDEVERVTAPPPATGERADRKIAPPGVELPDVPDTKRLSPDELDEAKSEENDSDD